MPKPRKALISQDDTTYYHCMNWCVHGAFLCDSDPLMSNHYHLLQYVDRDAARTWTMKELTRSGKQQ
jgi:hypothetical protein